MTTPPAGGLILVTGVTGMYTYVLLDTCYVQVYSLADMPNG